MKVPDDAECIATIIQSNKSNKYYLSYEFYKINGKCVYKKMEEYDVGITTQVVHPKLIDTKYIRNKKSFEKLKIYDIIIVVPVSRKRRNERGYNQSELIARAISKTLGIPIVKNVLVKIKNTVPQSSLNKVQRAENAKGV